MTLRRYLTRLIWVCTLPLLLLSALLAADRWRAQRAKDAHLAQDLLQAARELLDHNLSARLAGLQRLAASPLIDDPASWPAFRMETGGYLAAFGDHVALIDPQRRTRLHTMVPVGEAAPPAPLPAGRSAVALALDSGVPQVGDGFDGSVAQEPLVGLAAPVLRGGKAVYAIGTVVPLRQMEELLGDLPLGPGLSVTLFDSQGRLLARHGDAGEPGDADDDLRLTDRLRNAPWTLEVRALSHLAAQDQHRVAALLSALVLGTLLAAWIGGWLASRRLASSVRSLSDPPGAPQPPDEIIEILQVRRMLDDTQAQRERLEAERRDSDQRHREELERSAADLRASEAQLRSILDSASDAIIVTDDALSIVMANAVALRFFGGPGQTIVGMALQQLFPERLRAPQRAAVAGAVATQRAARGSGAHLEMIGLRADGSECPVEAAVSAVPLHDAPLVTVILRDVSGARSLQAELRASQAELRSLMSQQHRVEDRERRRIARELHDELQQVLVAIQMNVSSIGRDVAADPARLAPLVERIDELAGTAVTSTRRIVNDLRPLMLEELGLLPALEALCRQFEERTGIQARVRAGSDAAAWPRLPEQTEICLYRVAQESLTNVAKHSGATRVRLQLALQADGGMRMQVHDNGRGLEREGRRSPLAFGLKGMTERVRALGGSLHIRSGPGGGTVVEVEVGATPDEAAA